MGMGRHYPCPSRPIAIPSHNHEVGVFQIRAEAVSVNEITIASTAQTYMIKGRPWLSLCHKKTGLIRLLLQSRAASVQTIFHGQRAWYAA
uniref:Uncharacterized protein n=1 Tax=Oryza rufipogon TaxID=4529 RepID=A0A0E0R499_ORYRU